jgi:hypothetical protein
MAFAPPYLAAEGYGLADTRDCIASSKPAARKKVRRPSKKQEVARKKVHRPSKKQEEKANRDEGERTRHDERIALTGRHA